MYVSIMWRLWSSAAYVQWALLDLLSCYLWPAVTEVMFNNWAMRPLEKGGVPTVKPYFVPPDPC